MVGTRSCSVTHSHWAASLRTLACYLDILLRPAKTLVHERDGKPASLLRRAVLEQRLLFAVQHKLHEMSVEEAARLYGQAASFLRPPWH